jgi:hypothetical protein
VGELEHRSQVLLALVVEDLEVVDCGALAQLESSS